MSLVEPIATTMTTRTRFKAGLCIVVCVGGGGGGGGGGEVEPFELFLLFHLFNFYSSFSLLSVYHPLASDSDAADNRAIDSACSFFLLFFFGFVAS